MLKVSENIAFVLQTTLGSSFDNNCLFSPTTSTVKRAKLEDGGPLHSKPNGTADFLGDAVRADLPFEELTDLEVRSHG